MLGYSNAQNYHNPSDHHLYQTNPWPKEPKKVIYPWGANRSWTSSLESYRNAARKASFCLFHNGRRANFTVQLNLQRTYFVQDVPTLRAELTKLFSFLGRKKSIVAFAVLEITRNEFKTGPTDKIHVHFLVDTALDESELIDLFRRACKAAKFTPDDYRISKVKNIAGMSDGEYKHRCCNYVTKDLRTDNIVMFKRNLGFRKIRTVGKWWLDKNGNPTNMENTWDQAKVKQKVKQET